MLIDYWQGFALGAAMIIPLGPQNMFVINQAINRQYHLMAASLCAVSDIILISVGIFGGSAILGRSSILLFLITLCGAIFLFWYGWLTFKTAMKKPQNINTVFSVPPTRIRIILFALAVTWLNPHVYLDTVVILGSVGGQLTIQARDWFALGAVSASISWFFFLALFSAWASPWLKHPLVHRIIYLIVAIIMWAIALKLILYSGEMIEYFRLNRLS